MLEFELIQVALEEKNELSHSPNVEEWRLLYSFAKKQSLLGILLGGIKRLPSDQHPDIRLWLEWLGQSECIKLRNEVVCKRCIELQEHLRTDGFRICILKGQGVAGLYGSNLSNLRSSGDIDVWLDASKEQVIDYVMKRFPTKDFDQKHINLHCFKDVEVELHWIPAKWRSHKLNKVSVEYFESEKERQFSNVVAGMRVPTVDFQLVHQLMHVYSHYLYEGVGLRQMMDLYFAQMACMSNMNERINDIRQLFERLGLMKFVAATQWVQGEVFGLPHEGMICEPNKRYGCRLLEAMMSGGNFGHYDVHNHLASLSFSERLVRKWNLTYPITRFDLIDCFLNPYQKLKYLIWMRTMRKKYGV